MMGTSANMTLSLGLIALIVPTIGCDEDRRLAEMAGENARLQAEQNREMSQLNREVAQAHQEVIGLQHDLEEQQEGINAERDLLESERRDIAKQRRRDPLVADAVRGAALLLGCLAPLALAAYLLYCLRDRDEDQVIGELLIEELTTDRPSLLPSPPPESGDGRPPAIDADGARRRLPLTDTHQP